MDQLIYGKNDMPRIVGIEPADGQAEVFQQQPNGIIRSTWVKNEYWILATKPYGQGWVRLQGNLNYKWGKKFDNREHWFRTRQRLKTEDIYSIYDAKEALMIKDGYTYFKNAKHNEVSLLSFDIETTGLVHNSESEVLLIANTYRVHGKTLRRMFTYDDYESSGQMIAAWANWVRDEVNPSIVLGHNIVSFDLPYMSYVAGREGRSIELGRDGSSLTFSNYESKYRVDGSRDLPYHKIKCYGREIIDTLFLAYKYDVASRKYETYALKNIIKQEGLEVPNRIFYDAGQIRFTYKDPAEWAKIKEYAKFDADDSLALYDLMSPPFFYMTQSIPKSFQSVVESSTGSQINSMMSRSYLQIGHSLPKASEPNKYEGAISFGNPGIYKNVLKIDIKSLYPSIMLEYELFDNYKDPNGHFFQLVKNFRNDRLKNQTLFKETKDKYYDDLQSAQKIFANSLYGTLGAPGLLFNNFELAGEITRIGREMLNFTIDWASNGS